MAIYLDKPTDENSLQEQIIDLAHLLGWRVAHFRPALTKKGWRTAVSGDGKGFPDLVLTRGERLLFVELKWDKRKLTPEQEAWMDALGATPAECYVWRTLDDAAVMLR